MSHKKQRYFESRFTYKPGRKQVWRAIAAYLQRDIPASATLLEVGAGYCDFINQVRAAKKYAVDVWEGASDYCKEEVTFFHASAEEKVLPSASVDVIFASNLLEHLNESESALVLGTWRRMLRPSGHLILVQPNYFYCYRRYWDDYTHVKAYTHESLPDMLAGHGYAVERVEKRFLPFSFQRFLPRSYGLTRLYLALPWRPIAGQMLVVVQRGMEDV